MARRRRVHRALFAASAVVTVSSLVACGLIAGIDDYSIGKCKGGGVCSPDGGGGDDKPRQPGPKAATRGAPFIDP